MEYFDIFVKLASIDCKDRATSENTESTLLIIDDTVEIKRGKQI